MIAKDRKFKVVEGMEYFVLDMIFALLCTERIELLERANVKNDPTG